MKASFATARAIERMSRHILLAEDDEAFRNLLVDVLRDDGYIVEAVADGKALVERVSAALTSDNHLADIDLVLSDISMPHYNALDVLSGLRRAGIDVPVLLMTAFGSAETHRRAEWLGAIGVLNKPFDIDDLRTLICNGVANDTVCGMPHSTI